MPQYYFYSDEDDDIVAVDLPTIEAAKAEVIRYAAELLHWEPRKRQGVDQRRVQLKDSTNTVLYSVITSTIDEDSKPPTVANDSD